MTTNVSLITLQRNIYAGTYLMIQFYVGLFQLNWYISSIGIFFFFSRFDISDTLNLFVRIRLDLKGR